MIRCRRAMRAELDVGAHHESKTTCGVSSRGLLLCQSQTLDRDATLEQFAAADPILYYDTGSVCLHSFTCAHLSHCMCNNRVRVCSSRPKRQCVKQPQQNNYVFMCCWRCTAINHVVSISAFPCNPICSNPI